MGEQRSNPATTENLQKHQKVTAVVELIKDDYLVSFSSWCIGSPSLFARIDASVWMLLSRKVLQNALANKDVRFGMGANMAIKALKRIVPGFHVTISAVIKPEAVFLVTILYQIQWCSIHMSGEHVLASMIARNLAFSRREIDCFVLIIFSRCFLFWIRAMPYALHQLVIIISRWRMPISDTSLDRGMCAVHLWLFCKPSVHGTLLLTTKSFGWLHLELWQFF